MADALFPFVDGSTVNADPAVYSPDYFTPVPGGDLYASGEPTLSFPQCSTMLGCGDGTVTQDGTSGDPHDTTGLWATLAGISGSFLKGFTGSSSGTIHVGGSTSTAPKPVAAAADNSMLYLGLAAAAFVILILATRK